MSDEATQVLGRAAWQSSADLSAGERCPHCSQDIGAGEEFCANCGYQRGTWAEPAPQ